MVMVKFRPHAQRDHVLFAGPEFPEGGAHRRQAGRVVDAPG
jgi:hypothetical protein